MSNKMYEYFDRKSSEWSIQGFLVECDLEPLRKKIDCYIKCLETIASSGEGKRSETAKVLLDRYRKASIKNFFCYKERELVAWQGPISFSSFKTTS